MNVSQYRLPVRLTTILCAVALLLGSLTGLDLLLSLAVSAKAPAYTAEAVYPGQAADVAINGTGSGAAQMQNTDVVAMQVVLTADALAIATNVPSYSTDTGSATVALFAFDTDYDTTLLSSPIAEHTFVDFKDSADLTFRFSESEPLPAGEYILLLYDMFDETPGAGNGTGIGMWSYGAHEGQRAYVNGSHVSDRSFSVKVDYVGEPQALYGTPTKPAASALDYAPHMGAVLDFRDKSTMSALGNSNQTKATYMTEDGVSFVRLQPDKDANDPYQDIRLPDTLIKCSEYKYLLIKLRRSENSNLSAQVFFATDEVGISEPASVRPNYADTADWQYLVVNLGASNAYAGLLKSLRFDYYMSCDGYGTPPMDVQYMALFTSEEAALAFHDNFEDFKVPDTSEDPGDQPADTTPDYSTYLSADEPSASAPGKLTENGRLSYLYKDYTYTMDFTRSPDEYMAEGHYAFASIESAIVRNEVLQCKAFSTYTFYTKQMLGDSYGIRGGELSLDLVLESGSVTLSVRQVKPNDELTDSGLAFRLDADGLLTVADRDGFSDTKATGIDFSKPHRLRVRDGGDAIRLFVDDTEVYTLLWDAYDTTLRTPDGEAHTSIHLPGAGYASFRATRTRGYVDNVTYTYTDIVPKTVTASRPMDYSTWVATDDLDRTTPLNATVGDASDKQVGLFYFLIHSDDMNGRYVNDVTRFYLEGGVSNVASKLSSFAGRNGAYWAEPYFGYYSSHDTWVYRKHAYMLSAAGVDFIFLDVSNNKFYVEQATILFDTWKSIRDEGGTTPQIAFMYGDMPTTLLNGLYTLLEPFYQNPDYQDLLYCYDGKPLVLGNSDTPTSRTWTVSGTTPQTRDDYRNLLKSDAALNAFYENEYKNVLSEMTVRKCWAWQAGTYKGYWDWLQNSPQSLGTNARGKVEQIAVSMGTHAHSSLGRSSIGGDNTYNPNGNFGFTLGTAKYGYFFAEQFEYALSQDVDVVMITGWNEWYAGVQQGGGANQTTGQTATPNYYMVDQMSPEYSRDGEPMKLRDGEGFGDNYYYQMVSYIRRFKGLSAAPATVNGGAMSGASAADWDKVAPAFTDNVGDTDLRSELSFAAEFRYVNGSARNDLDTAKVSQDATHIYFYISTATPLITVDDEYWMNLYIDIDADPATGWEGFDLLLNRARTDKQVSIEMFRQGDWDTDDSAYADYEIGENYMVISVEKKLIGLAEGEVASFNFKWADNARVEGDVMRFMTEGDCAPNDRFMFAYTASTLNDERAFDETEGSDSGVNGGDLPATELPEESGCGGCGSSIGGVVLPIAAMLIGAVLTTRRRKKAFCGK